MLKGKILKNFCLLVLQIGVNIQKGQGLEIACPVEKREIAEELTKTAYLLGAKKVNIRWEDEKISLLSYRYASTEALCEVPKWFVDSKNYLVKENYCYVAISAENPLAFKDIPADKLSAVSKIKSTLLKKFSDAVMGNEIRWCVVSVPTKEWAKQVFPNSKNPIKDLSCAIEHTMRLDKLDPVQEWNNHIETLNRRANFLNEKNFDYLRFYSKSGTDLRVGLAKNHLWLSAKERAKDGVQFIANMPTEEIFTAPHKYGTDGIVKSAMPLCYNGNIIDDFSITFKQGKVVDYSAKVGYQTLKSIIETDAGTKRLGEVALIGKSSPIAELNCLFYNTLFDENASCHLALGKAYPTTVYSGQQLSKKELSDLGLNDSIEHVDFMIGTKDLCVYGCYENKNNETPILIDGDFVI